MAEPRGLVLYGDSVFLAGLKAALSRYEALEPITIESGRHGDRRPYPGAEPSVPSCLTGPRRSPILCCACCVTGQICW